MPYGTVKVDNITFDQGGADQNVTVSGIYRAITSGVTVTGTISGVTIIGTTTVSGTTVTGTTVQGETVQGVSGTFTSLTGTTTTGTTAQFTSGAFVSVTGITTTGTTANFVSGVFTTRVSGLTVTGTTSNFTSGNFVTLSGATATFTSGVIASGTASAPSLSIISDPNTGLWSPAADTIAASIGGVEKARLDSSGRLLVGAASTAKGDCTLLLEGNANGGTNAGCLVIAKGETTPIDGATLGQIQFTDNNHTSGVAGAAIIATRNGATWSAGSKPGALSLNTTPNGSTTSQNRIIILSNGEINLNTTSGATINVGTGTTDGISYYPPGTSSGIFQASNNANAVGLFRRRGSDGGILDFRRDTTQVGTISVTASATAYNTSSDYRLKENVVLLTGAINRLQQIPVHRFNFIADPGNVVDGFIAHEAAAVVPECVTGIKDEEDEDGNPVYQGIDQSKLVPLLAAALQEAIGRIETLEAEVTALTTTS